MNTIGSKIAGMDSTSGGGGDTVEILKRIEEHLARGTLNSLAAAERESPADYSVRVAEQDTTRPQAESGINLANLQDTIDGLTAMLNNIDTKPVTDALVAAINSVTPTGGGEEPEGVPISTTGGTGEEEEGGGTTEGTVTGTVEVIHTHDLGTLEITGGNEANREAIEAIVRATMTQMLAQMGYDPTEMPAGPPHSEGGTEGEAA